jgi:hypothetical protein
LRIATWNVGLERPGPGLLLRDIDRGGDPQVAAIRRIIIALDADILVLTGFDHDPALHALAALAGQLAADGTPYPHLFALNGNNGLPTGFDIDADGRTLEPEDAMGWGRFPGAGGSAILSRLPIQSSEVRDFTTFLWRDLPQSLIPPATDPGLAAVQRLSSHGHWQVPVTLPDDSRLDLLIWHATPPVFDGPEDRNGRRNHDEAAFWLHFLAGRLPFSPPADPVVLLGDANLDPMDGEGRPDALRALLTHPRLQDPAPQGSHSRHDPEQQGNPRLDTALYDQLGGLRLDYILPDRRLRVTGAGVLWPATGDPLLALLDAASHHRPVWIDIALGPD